MSIHQKVYEFDGARHCMECRKTWHLRGTTWELEPDTCTKVYTPEEELRLVKRNYADLKKLLVDEAHQQALDMDRMRRSLGKMQAKLSQSERERDILRQCLNMKGGADAEGLLVSYGCALDDLQWALNLGCLCPKGTTEHAKHIVNIAAATIKALRVRVKELTK